MTNLLQIVFAVTNIWVPCPGSMFLDGTNYTREHMVTYTNAIRPVIQECPCCHQQWTNYATIMLGSDTNGPSRWVPAPTPLPTLPGPTYPGWHWGTNIIYLTNVTTQVQNWPGFELRPLWSEYRRLRDRELRERE